MAASLGWMLDAFDVMLFSLLLASIMADLHLTKEQGGALGRLGMIFAVLTHLLTNIFAPAFATPSAACMIC